MTLADNVKTGTAIAPELASCLPVRFPLGRRHVFLSN